mmetsp:Transcript_30606/g.47955  ORF Transcript_30606/g.47955 Transcript_30606/m.47955 type:complete len:203 (-) Transcript_30606:63-671(-)
MNFVAALLLLELNNEEASFWVLVNLVEEVLPNYYHRSLFGLTVDQGVLQEYMILHFPKIHKHFQAMFFDLAFVSTNWLLCIFINSLPWDCVLRLMDILLYDGKPDILLRCSLAILSMMQSKILFCRTQEDLFNVMKPKGAFLTLEKGQPIEAAHLMKVIYTKIPPLLDIQERRAKHLPTQLAKLRYSKASPLLHATPQAQGL